MANLDSLPENADELWDEPEEKKSFAKKMLPFMLLGFIQGVENTAQKKKPVEVLTFFKKEKYDSKSVKYASEVVGTTKEALQSEIDAAIENGEGVRELASRINDLFGRSMGYRSLRIARTQLTESINDGTVSTLAAEGNQYKEWSTVIDGLERDSHHEADGQVVGINESFRLVGGQAQAPGDDNLPPEEKINCRCTCVAADNTEGRSRRLGQLFLRTHSALERRYMVSLRGAFIAQRDRILARFPT